MSIIETTFKRGFKKKTIEKTISYKMINWLKTIDNEELKKDITRDYIVTGGAITSMLQGDLPNDYDVYFRTVDTAAKVAEYYLSKVQINNDKVSKFGVIKHEGRVEVKIKSSGVASEADDQKDYNYFEGDPSGAAAERFIDNMDSATINAKEDGATKYRVALMTSNAISLTDDIQLIIRFCGDPEVIHHNFDFMHTTNWYTYDEGLHINPDALMATITRELKYVGSLYPVCSIFRLKKFIKRGWSITAGEMFKIAYDISKLDLSNPVVLQEQLTGVDAAYFFQLISILKQEKNRDLDRTYLFELVNRVFDEGEKVDESQAEPSLEQDSDD